MQPRIRRYHHVERALHLETARPALLLGIEPIPTHQALQHSRSLGAQEISLNVHADQQRPLDVAEHLKTLCEMLRAKLCDVRHSNQPLHHVCELRFASTGLAIEDKQPLCSVVSEQEHA